MKGEAGVVVASVRNPRIVRARKLGRRKYRQRDGRFLVEGLQLIHMGLARGLRPETLFYAPELFTGPGAPSLLERARRAGAQAVQVTPPVLAALSNRDTCQGLVAVFPLFSGRWPAGGSGEPGLALVLDRLQSPGNLGTLLRTADAVGAAGALVLEPAADPFDPAAVRASMGSLFNVPVLRQDAVEPLAERLGGSGFSLVGADPHRGIPWDRFSWPRRTALVLGNEARGLSPDLVPRVAHWVRLPMVGGAESLNVAVTGGVLMYGWLSRWGGPGEP